MLNAYEKPELIMIEFSEDEYISTLQVSNEGNPETDFDDFIKSTGGNLRI